MEFNNNVQSDNRLKLESLSIKYEEMKRIYIGLQQDFFNKKDKADIDFGKIEAELDELQNNIIQLKKLI